MHDAEAIEALGSRALGYPEARARVCRERLGRTRLRGAARDRRSVRAVTRRRAHRRRPPSFGVHARRARPRSTQPLPPVSSPTRSRPTSQSTATTEYIRFSAHSTSCRSSRSPAPRPSVTRRAGRARVRAMVGRDPWRAGLPVRRRRPRRPRSPGTSVATRSEPAHPTSVPTHPHPTLGATAVGARKPLVAINLLLTTDDVTVARRIARADPRTGRRTAGRARARIDARIGRPPAGVDEPRRPRPHRDRGRLPRSPRARRRERTDVDSVELVGLVPRPRARSVLRRVLAVGRDRRDRRHRSPHRARPKMASLTTRLRPTALPLMRSKYRLRICAWTAWGVASRRGLGGRGHADGGCGDAPARTCRPRSRTSHRDAARTRDTRT